jgi:putative acetyltransferase
LLVLDLRRRRALFDDAPAYVRLMSDERVYPDLMQTPYASVAQWRDRLAAALPPHSGDLMLVADHEGELVGMGSLHPIGTAARRRHAMSLGLSVQGDHQGQGVGHVLMAALVDYADKWTMRCVWS